MAKRKTKYQACLSEVMTGKGGKPGPRMRAAHKTCKKRFKKKRRRR